MQDHKFVFFKIYALNKTSEQILFLCRECAPVLSSPLALFLNTSFSQGQLPCIWKSAHITPVHMKGSKNRMENYRQMSLTCIVCKIAEAVVRTRVVDLWSDLNLFNPDQSTYLLKGLYVGTIINMLQQLGKG